MQFSNTYRYILIIIAALLLIFRLVITDFDQWEWKDAFGFISLLLLILAMVLSIKHVNKKKKELTK